MNYKIELLEDVNKLFDLIKNIDLTDKLIPELQKLVDAKKIENELFNINQITKYASNSNYYGVIVKLKTGEIGAVAVCIENLLKLDDICIAQIFSIKKGYGKILLEEFIKNVKNSWLECDPSEKTGKLKQYYEKVFNGKGHEVTIYLDIFKKDVSFFHNFDDNDKFEKALKKYYNVK